MVETTMGKAVAEVALRIWTPQNGRVRYLKQVSPTLADLTGMRAPVDQLTGDYPTGAWGAETRVYHLCVEVAPGTVGQEIRGPGCGWWSRAAVRSSPGATCWPSGPTTWPCPPGSARAWPTTPGRRSCST
nr:hypothetical protein GCM10020093_000650 [Planobispora longispora]